jgi:hypothetical protein
MRKRCIAISYTIAATIAGNSATYYGIVYARHLPHGATVETNVRHSGWQSKFLPALRFAIRRGVEGLSATQFKMFKSKAKMHQIAIYEESYNA